MPHRVLAHIAGTRCSSKVDSPLRPGIPLAHRLSATASVGRPTTERVACKRTATTRRRVPPSDKKFRHQGVCSWPAIFGRAWAERGRPTSDATDDGTQYEKKTARRLTMAK